MDAPAHIHGDGATRPGFGCSPAGEGGGDSLARNLGRMCGHIMAAIREPVDAGARALECDAAGAGPSRNDSGTVVARRVQRCDAPGPEGTMLRRTVVDEIVAPVNDRIPTRGHHAS
jgi:hypothetical protein